MLFEGFVKRGPPVVSYLLLGLLVGLDGCDPLLKLVIMLLFRDFCCCGLSTLITVVQLCSERNYTVTLFSPASVAYMQIFYGTYVKPKHYFGEDMKDI